MRRGLWIAAAALMAGAGLATAHLMQVEGRRISHHFAVYRPGEASPFAEFKERIAFSPLAGPLAVGERFYLVGAKQGRCSAAGKTRDPLMILALDPSTQQVEELPAVDAPEARTDPRVVAVDDGLLLLGGQQRAELGECLGHNDLTLRLAIWAYEHLPLARVPTLDKAFDDFVGKRSMRVAAPEVPTFVRESYRYRFSRRAWERVTALDVDSVGEASDEFVEPFDDRVPISASAPELVPNVGSSGNAYHLDLVAERRVSVPSLDTLAERGIPIENSWVKPSIIDGKLVLFFPQGTLSARSAAAINDQNREERRSLEELPVDESWQNRLNQLAAAVAPHAGLVFDIKAGSWSPINSAGAPWQQPYDEFHGTTATDARRLVVFTGEAKRPGAIYDPRTDRWTPITRQGAPSLDSMEAATFGAEIAAFYTSDPAYDGKPRDRNIYLYNAARNSWRTLAGVPGPMITSVTETSRHLLLWSATEERLEWLDGASAIRTPLIVAPHFAGFQFAVTSDVALLYNVDESGE